MSKHDVVYPCPDIEIEHSATWVAQLLGTPIEIQDNGNCLDYTEKQTISDYFDKYVLNQYNEAKTVFDSTSESVHKDITEVQDLIKDEIKKGGPDVEVLQRCLDRKHAFLRRLNAAFIPLEACKTVRVAQAFKDLFVNANMEYPIQAIGDPCGEVGSESERFVWHVREQLDFMLAHTLIEETADAERELAQRCQAAAALSPIPHLELPPPAVFVPAVFVPDSPPPPYRPMIPARDVEYVPESPPLQPDSPVLLPLAPEEEEEEKEPVVAPPEDEFKKHVHAARRRCLARNAKTVEVGGVTQLLVHNVSEFTDHNWRRPKYLKEQMLVRLMNDLKGLIEYEIHNKYGYNTHNSRTISMLALCDSIFRFWWRDGSNKPYDQAVALAEAHIEKYINDLP